MRKLRAVQKLQGFQMTAPTPTSEGFWWGKWALREEGTADYATEGDVVSPVAREWEVMHVVENTLDETDDNHLMVMVPGVGKWQPLENFIWGPGPLEMPK